ncbi:hypothetical protein BH11PLA1_BH11PLA1_12680 [soil metagenome]
MTMQELDRRILLAGAGALGVAALTRMAKAGPLSPPDGAVAPTGVTMDQIAQRVAKSATGSAEPRTCIAELSGDAQADFIITQPGSYYLHASLTSVKSICIDVRASFVDLDLQGFCITGSDAQGALSTCVHVKGGFHSVRVHDGSLCPGGGAALDAQDAIVVFEHTIVSPRDSASGLPTGRVHVGGGSVLSHLTMICPPSVAVAIQQKHVANIKWTASRCCCVEGGQIGFLGEFTLTDCCASSCSVAGFSCSPDRISATNFGGWSGDCSGCCAFSCAVGFEDISCCEDCTASDCTTGYMTRAMQLIPERARCSATRCTTGFAGAACCVSCCCMSCDTGFSLREAGSGLPTGRRQHGAMCWSFDCTTGFEVVGSLDDCCAMRCDTGFRVQGTFSDGTSADITSCCAVSCTSTGFDGCAMYDDCDAVACPVGFQVTWRSTQPPQTCACSACRVCTCVVGFACTSSCSLDECDGSSVQQFAVITAAGAGGGPHVKIFGCCVSGASSGTGQPTVGISCASGGRCTVDDCCLSEFTQGVSCAAGTGSLVTCCAFSSCVEPLLMGAGNTFGPLLVCTAGLGDLNQNQISRHALCNTVT